MNAQVLVAVGRAAVTLFLALALLGCGPSYTGPNAPLGPVPYGVSRSQYAIQGHTTFHLPGGVHTSCVTQSWNDPLCSIQAILPRNFGSLILGSGW